MRRRLMSDYRQGGVGQHRQGDVPVPALPFAHFILVQPNLPLGLLKTPRWPNEYPPPAPVPPGLFLLDRSTRSRPTLQAWLRCAGPKPVPLARLPYGPDLCQSRRRSLGPITGAQPDPARLFNPRRQPVGPHLSRPPVGQSPQLLIALDSQHVRNVSSLQPQPQVVIAINRV